MVKRDRDGGRKSLRKEKRALGLWRNDVPRRERVKPIRLDEETCGQVRSKGIMRADIRVLANACGVSDVRAARFLLANVDPWDIQVKTYDQGLTRAAAAREYYRENAEYLAVTFDHPPRF